MNKKVGKILTAAAAGAVVGVAVKKLQDGRKEKWLRWRLTPIFSPF